MTSKQFLKHKWKLGEKVWVLTEKKIGNFRINAYRMVETTVDSIEYVATKSGTEIISVGVDYPKLENEECLCNFTRLVRHGSLQYSAQDCCYYLFTTKKSADKFLEKAREEDDVQGRLKTCISLAEEDVVYAQKSLKKLKDIMKHGL